MPVPNVPGRLDGQVHQPGSDWLRADPRMPVRSSHPPNTPWQRAGPLVAVRKAGKTTVPLQATAAGSAQ